MDLGSGSLQSDGSASRKRARSPRGRGKRMSWVQAMSRNTADMLARSNMEQPELASSEPIMDVARSFRLQGLERRNGAIATFLSFAAAALSIAAFATELGALDAALSLVTVAHVGVVSAVHVCHFQRKLLWCPEWRHRYPHFVCSPLFPACMFELVAVAIHCPPGLSGAGG
eukprot:gene45657-62262_t